MHDAVSPSYQVRTDSLAWQQVNDEVVVLDLLRSEYVSFNSSAGFLWRGVVSGATRVQLIERLVAEYHIDDARALRDVDAFIGECCRRGFLA